MATKEQIKLMVKILQQHDDLKEFVTFKNSIGKRKGLEDRQTIHNELFKDLRRKVRAFREILATSDIWLLDYSAQSATRLKEKKNRYFLDSHGNYLIKGYVVALNAKSREVIAIETRETQLTHSDIERLKKYLPLEAIILTDRQHREASNTTKKLTQLIEDYFAGLKTTIYRELKCYQSFRKGKVVTNVSYEWFDNLYSERINKLGWKIKERVIPKQKEKRI